MVGRGEGRLIAHVSWGTENGSVVSLGELRKTISKVDNPKGVTTGRSFSSKGK